MKIQASMIASWMLQALLARTVTSMCSGGNPNIYLDHDHSELFDYCYTHGRAAMAWETYGGDFSDDEYFIQLYQGGSEIYWAGQFEGHASGSSGVRGTVGGKNGFQPRFKCDLEASLQHCDNGGFRYKVVDCGCQDGYDEIQACKYDTYSTAQDAVCVGYSNKPITGRWEQIGAGPGVSYSLTEKTTWTRAETITKAVTDKISASISAGFEFKAFSTSATIGLEQATETSNSITTSIQKTVENQITINCQESPTGLNYVFQWVMQQPDESDRVGFTVQTSNFICTTEGDMKPRCPANFCKDAACQVCREPFENSSAPTPNPTLPPTSRPTPAPTPSPTNLRTNAPAPPTGSGSSGSESTNCFTAANQWFTNQLSRFGW